VREGHLVDYDVIRISSDVKMNGVFLQPGENVEYVDPETGLSRMDQLEDERQFDAADVEAKITAPESNKKIINEIRTHATAHEQRYGRFPKTLRRRTEMKVPFLADSYYAAQAWTVWPSSRRNSERCGHC
jgi:type I restriction enzyme R subunit